MHADRLRTYANVAAADRPLAEIRQAMMDKHETYIAQAAGDGAQITCLQEIFNGPYFCAEQTTRWYDMTEPIPNGPTIKRMQELAKKHRMAMIVPIYEVENEGVYYNTACFESQAGRIDDALNHLRRAVELLPALADLAREDEDFEPLRDRPEFAQVVGDQR